MNMRGVSAMAALRQQLWVRVPVSWLEDSSCSPAPGVVWTLFHGGAWQAVCGGCHMPSLASNPGTVRVLFYRPPSSVKGVAPHLE